ncbi:MAG TPA: glycosyltransferase family 4 protein [Cyanothece sp. UBA12306]|nr:glycosyltransferase family 4 protein [Cyanothece sp. UBA12306]
MRLTLVISSLSSGGAERVMSIMANYWASQSREFDITILTFDDGSQPPFYDLDSRIEHIPLGLAKKSPNIVLGLWNNLKRISKLRRAIRRSKPDTVISFANTTNVITLLAMQGLPIPIIVSERVDPSKYDIGVIWEQLRWIIYPIANYIVVQTQKVANYFPSSWQNKIEIIPNPVLFSKQIKSSSERLLTKYSIIAIGRLVEQKGFDLLLKAFATLKDSYPEWSLTILGEGSLRLELELLRDRLEITDSVNFVGRVKNPYDYLQQADLFVMSSRFEGFPNALCEAMACGLPVIATDCPSGPREIIRDGIDGILVTNENMEDLALAMGQLMSNEKERKRLAESAKEITERFRVDKIIKKWENLLDTVVKEQKRDDY